MLIIILCKAIPSILRLAKLSSIKVTGTGLLLGGVALFTLYELYKFRAVGNLVFFPGQVMAMTFKGSVPVLDFAVTIENTSSLPVTVNSIAGNLFTNDTLIGNIYSVTPIAVPGNGKVQAQLEAELSIVGVVNDLIRAFKYRNFSQDVLFDGYANVGGLQVPIGLAIKVGA